MKNFIAASRIVVVQTSASYSDNVSDSTQWTGVNGYTSRTTSIIAHLNFCPFLPVGLARSVSAEPDICVDKVQQAPWRLRLLVCFPLRSEPPFCEKYQFAKILWIRASCNCWPLDDTGRRQQPRQQNQSTRGTLTIGLDSEDSGSVGPVRITGPTILSPDFSPCLRTLSCDLSTQLKKGNEI